MENMATILGEVSNAAVVQLPSRKFPSICIQGDTLVNLTALISRLALNAKNNVTMNEDDIYDLVYVNNVLTALSFVYDKTLTASAVEKPYSTLNIAKLSHIELD